MIIQLFSLDIIPMNKTFLSLSILFLIGFFPNGLHAQSLPDPFSISINATSTAPPNEFRIAISRKGDDLKLVYSLRDSISYRLNLDKSYFALNDLIMASFATASRDSLAKLGAKQDSIRNHYSIFSKDSLLLKLNDQGGYAELLKKIQATNNVMLTNSSANASRNMREGALFSFTITDAKGSRLVYAQSPTSSTNPLLYQLITESLKLYRDKKPGAFLDKSRTNNY